jgi:citrate synthase
MGAIVRDLMSAPPVTCDAASSLASAARRMQGAGIGSVVVVERGKVTGILTERDLLRAAAAGVRPTTEPVRLWMTAGPDVLGPDEEASTAWESLTHHHYRHLPVVEDGELLGVVSIRDLYRSALLRPAGEHGIDVPRGLEGVVVAETTVGDVRGEEGFYHYRQYPAVELAARRSLEDVWYLLVEGNLPDAAQAAAFGAQVASLRTLPEGLASLLAELAKNGTPLDVLRTAVSLLGAELGWAPTLDVDRATLRQQALQLCAAVPTILTAAHRLRTDQKPIAPRADLPFAANYLWMLQGTEPAPELARAVEQYLMLVIDHGFNASTFTARVITSTGADLAAAICGAVGALSGPLHGGAPSRALAMLDAIGPDGAGRVDRSEAWLRDAVERGDRIMGFGHRVYKTEDPRAVFLRDVARTLGGPMVAFATEVERVAVDVLAELKPGRRLYTNVEFYTGVVLDTCGIPRQMFTPTFAAGRTIGWTTHVMEQAAENRLIRPAARYVGPAAPVPVPLAVG